MIRCLHCGERAVLLLDSTPIYGHDYGPRWHCAPCDAHVGCHPGTTEPLGAPADHETRAARWAAHRAFDPVWRYWGDRRGGYAWLAKAMGLPKEQCHIGMMNLEQCRRVVELCRERKRA